MQVNFFSNVAKYAQCDVSNKSIISFAGTKGDSFEPSKKANSPSILRTFMNLDKNYLKQLAKIRMTHKSDILTLLFHPEICYKDTIINKLSDDACHSLNKLKMENFKQYNLVLGVLMKVKLYTKTKDGISEDYITNFVKTLMNCHPVLLQNVIDNNIPIKIYDDLCLYLGAHQATFCHGKKIVENSYDENGLQNVVFNRNIKYIEFAERALSAPITLISGAVQNTYESLPHELGHAFDHYNGTKLGLTPQDIVTVDFEKQENNIRFSPLASFSKEFDTAFFNDYMHMGEVDENNGRKFGETFEELLKNPSFNYYLGVDSGKNKNSLSKEGKETELLVFDDIKARKELFAQMVSYVTSGTVTDAEFAERIEDLFPNCLAFTKDIIQKAEKI